MYSVTNNLLTVENVGLQFDENLILRDINLQIKDIVRTETTGQISTIVGKSGAGKSVLLKTIAGLIKPTKGKVLIGEQQLPVKVGQVGMVAQNYPLFNHYTLKTNLKLVCKDKEKINDLLNQFNLLDKQDLYPIQLSGGQRQRAAIVQQILCSEHFILLDEPFSGLDPVSTQKLCDVILKVANLNSLNTILITSHILEPALAVSDSVFVLGHEYTEEIIIAKREKIPGATIRYTKDLAAMGLAWQPDIRYNPQFLEVVKSIEELFKII